MRLPPRTTAEAQASIVSLQARLAEIHERAYQARHARPSNVIPFPRRPLDTAPCEFEPGPEAA
jgi:hypothetical protein